MDSYDPFVISSRIKQWRTYCKMTLDDVAVKTGISKSKLSKAENTEKYKQKITVDFLIRFSVGMRVSIDYLVGLSFNPEGDPLQAAAASTVRVTEGILESNLKEFSRLILNDAVCRVDLENLYSDNEKRHAELADVLARFISANHDKFEVMYLSNTLSVKLDASKAAVNSLKSELKHRSGVKNLSLKNKKSAIGLLVDDALSEEMPDAR